MLNIERYCMACRDMCWGFSGGSVAENLPASAGDMGLNPESGRSPGEGNDNLLQYSCLGNLMNRRSCWAALYGVAKESDATLLLIDNKEQLY